MPSPIDVRYDRGIYLPELDFWMDPHGRRDMAFVSHAHADHFARHDTIICSQRTHALLAKRYGTPKKSRIISLAYGEKYAVCEGYHFHLNPAGHIFGSAQCHLTREKDGATLLYSGDFKLHPGYSAEAIQIEHAQTLIMETTFGLPRFRFPPTEEVVAAVVKFCRETLEDDEIPILLGYSLGKAQEILAALTEASFPVMLHQAAYDMAEVYEHWEQPFPPYALLDIKKAPGHVLILPPSVARSQPVRELKHTRTAMLSGWALQPGAIYRYQVDAVFPLSDHADYPDLMRYVDGVKPDLVYTLHGYAAEFARDLREKGLDAWSILTDNQLDLDLACDRDIGALRENRAVARIPCSLADLSDVSRQVAEVTGKARKTSLLADYFRGLNEDDLRRAALFLSGKIFGHPAKQRSLGMGFLVRKALLRVSGMNLARYRDIAGTQADAGRTAYLILNGSTQPEGMTLFELEEEFIALAQAKGPLAKEGLLGDLLRRLHPCEGRFVIQVLTNELRSHLKESLLEDALAEAFHRSPAEVREAHMLLGDLGDAAEAARRGALDKVSLRPFQSVNCMLANPIETARAVWDRLGAGRGVVWLEDKMNGIRAQLHRQGDRTALFSPDGRSLDDEFPEICRAAQGLADDVVLDGELIAYAEGKKMTFLDLQKRLGRKRLEADLFLGESIPPRFMIFDLLWHNGESFLKKSLGERRRRLDLVTLPGSFHRVPVIEAKTPEAIKEAFRQMRLSGSEGLVAKDPASHYAPGRPDQAWLKLEKKG